VSVYSLSSADAHQAIATAHRVLANPELTPLVMALVNQCLQSEVRPEHGIMLLLRANQSKGDTHEKSSYCV